MEDAFWKLENAKRCYLAGVCNDYTQVIKLCKDLLQTVDKCSEDKIKYFKDSQYDDLVSLKHFLVDQIPRDNTFRSLHDKIFTKYFLLHKTPSSVTIIFEDLIKGITYFVDQIDHKQPNPSPIYHRLLSCGPNHIRTFRETYLQCKLNQSKHKVQNTRKRIERCYTERLIYNELYINEQLSFLGAKKWESPLLPIIMTDESPPSQDEGHLHWLNETRNDFHSCFPDHEIKITLENYVGMFPTKMIIARYFKNILTSTEIYIKTVNSTSVKKYLTVVDCYRQTKKVNQIKFQRFEKKSTWITVDSIRIPPTIPSKYPTSEYQSITCI
jgi:hypothetical protein